MYLYWINMSAPDNFYLEFFYNIVHSSTTNPTSVWQNCSTLGEKWISTNIRWSAPWEIGSNLGEINERIHSPSNFSYRRKKFSSTWRPGNPLLRVSLILRLFWCRHRFSSYNQVNNSAPIVSLFCRMPPIGDTKRILHLILPKKWMGFSLSVRNHRSSNFSPKNC